MLSSPILYPSPKSLTPFRFRQLPISKYPILISGLSSKRLLANRLRVSDPRSTSELARVDALREREDEAVLGDGSVGIGRDVAWAEVESFLNKMSKWLVAALFGIIILWKHDAGAMWAAMGSVANSWLSFTLKRILNHQRPVSASRSDPGMPSSHAQSIFYIVIYALLSLVDWIGINSFSMTAGAVILICGSYFSWLRISQKLHTVSQVLVGAALGSTCAITWFWLWQAIVLEAFISFVSVRVIIVLGSLTFWMSFLIFVIQHWLMDE